MYKIAIGLLRWTLFNLFRLEIRGAEHLKSLGDRVLIVANHTSLLDGVLLYLLLPTPPTFAINTQQHETLYVRAVRWFVRFVTLDPGNPLSTRTLIQRLNQNENVVIFPEGRITVTGALMKIYNGPGLVALKTGAQILPVGIEGAQYSVFSYMHGLFRLRWFPKVVITIRSPQVLQVPDDVQVRDQREYAGRLFADIMTETIFQSAVNHPADEFILFDRLLEARHLHGRQHEIVEDTGRQPLNYDRLIKRAILVGRYIVAKTTHSQLVGLMLPNSVDATIAFWGLQAYGRIPAMLNYSAGESAVVNSCQAVGLSIVVTSRAFTEQLKQNTLVETLAQNVELIYVEDIVKQISITDRLWARQVARRPVLLRRLAEKQIDTHSPAVIMFTLDGENTVKHITLTHMNLLASIKQLTTRLDFNAQDVMLNVIPLFNLHGLLASMLLPMLNGVKVFLYPTPAHHRVIPEVAYEANATIFFATNSMLAAYGEAAHPYDFFSMRHVIAVEEHLDQNTRQLWQEKFGIRVLESYSTTTGMMISMNTPMDYCKGSVGRLLPGIECKLQPVEGNTTGRQLYVRGPSIVSKKEDGWFDTGELVEIDEEGFISLDWKSAKSR